MAKKDIKKLTNSELKKQVKKINEVEDILVVVNGTDYLVTCDAIFRKSKMHKVLDDLVDFFNEGGKRTEILDLATPYTALLILKHFTSLEVSDDVGEAIDLLEVLIDLEILDKILNALPVAEVTKIYELIAKTTTSFQETLEMMEKEAESLVDKVENEEVRKKVQEMIDNGEIEKK